MHTVHPYSPCESSRLAAHIAWRLMARRVRYEGFDPSQYPRWIRGNCQYGMIVFDHQQPLGINLRVAFGAAIERLRGQGWTIESGDVFQYGSTFANRHGVRIHVSLVPSEPKDGNVDCQKCRWRSNGCLRFGATEV